MKKKIISFLIMFFLLPISLIYGCSCSDKEFNPGDSNTEVEETEDASTPKLYLSKDSVSLKTQETATVQVKCTQNFTDFFYNATSYNTTIAQVSKSDKTITIKGISEGSTIIEVTSSYGDDTLVVSVSKNSITLTTYNYSTYLSFSSSYSGTSAYATAKILNSSKYDVDFSALVSISVNVFYKYYETDSRTKVLYKYNTIPRSYTFYEDDLYYSESLYNQIRNGCPSRCISYEITSVSVKVTNIYGTVKY